MKKSEIIIGHYYTNGNGRTRKVIDTGAQYKLYDAQVSDENLRYEVVKDGSKTNRTAGEQQNMTIAAFARWARYDVTAFYKEKE